MNPTQHTSNNRVLGAPKSWDQGELGCSALAITDHEIQGHQCLSSFWRPDAVELEALAKGGMVMVSAYGGTMPPISVAVVTNN